MVVTLPPHRVDRITLLLATTLRQCYSSRRKWQQLLGKLRSVMMALHSAKFLCSILQNQLVSVNSCRFCLHGLTRQALRGWEILIQTLHDNPVPISTLVPHARSTITKALCTNQTKQFDYSMIKMLPETINCTHLK